MKTSSLWGKPQSRYYSYLNRIEPAEHGQRPSLAVVGCADGKHVLPAARKGFDVWAIDIDEIAIEGGAKHDDSGATTMPGLRARLQREGLTSRVDVRCGDFMTERPDRLFDGVFTSGALQYSFNSGHRLARMVEGVVSLARLNGHVYFDYMLPLEEKYKGRENCPEREWWAAHFADRSDIKVLSHRVLPPVMDKAHVEFPVDHYHQWGHVELRRTA